jgi:hypothetical protein
VDSEHLKLCNSHRVHTVARIVIFTKPLRLSPKCGSKSSLIVRTYVGGTCLPILDPHTVELSSSMVAGMAMVNGSHPCCRPVRVDKHPSCRQYWPCLTPNCIRGRSCHAARALSRRISRASSSGVEFAASRYRFSSWTLLTAGGLTASSHALAQDQGCLRTPSAWLTLPRTIHVPCRWAQLAQP